MAFELDSRLLAQYGNPQTQSVFKDSGGSFVKGVSSGMALGNQYKAGKRADELHNISLETAARNKEEDVYNKGQRGAREKAARLEAERATAEEARKVRDQEMQEAQETRDIERNNNAIENRARLIELHDQNMAKARAIEDSNNASRQLTATKQKELTADGTSSKYAGSIILKIRRAGNTAEALSIVETAYTNPNITLTRADRTSIMGAVGEPSTEGDARKQQSIRYLNAFDSIRANDVDGAIEEVAKAESSDPSLIATISHKKTGDMLKDSLVITRIQEDGTTLEDERSIMELMGGAGSDFSTLLNTYASLEKTKKNAENVQKNLEINAAIMDVKVELAKYEAEVGTQTDELGDNDITDGRGVLFKHQPELGKSLTEDGNLDAEARLLIRAIKLATAGGMLRPQAEEDAAKALYHMHIKTPPGDIAKLIHPDLAKYFGFTGTYTKKTAEEAGAPTTLNAPSTFTNTLKGGPTTVEDLDNFLFSK